MGARAPELIVRHVEYRAGMGDPVFDTTGVVLYAMPGRADPFSIHWCERCGCTHWKPNETARHRCKDVAR